MPKRSNKHLLIQKNDVPFVCLNTVRNIAGSPRALMVAVLEIGDSYLGIEYQLGLHQVVLCVAKKEHFPHFYSLAQDNLSEVVADLKSKALTGGATLEAIQLLKELTELTTAEEAEMANPKAAAAAKNAKIAKKGETKAAKAAKEPKAPDTRKIKVLKKDHGARENSKTARRYDMIIGAKTVQEALDATDGDLGITMADVNYAEKQGVISIG